MTAVTTQRRVIFLPCTSKAVSRKPPPLNLPLEKGEDNQSSLPFEKNGVRMENNKKATRTVALEMMLRILGLKTA